MKHKVKLTKSEKLRACLDLSDFVFRTMKNTLSRSEFNKRMKNLRKKHLKEDMILLKKMGRVKK